MNRRIFVLLPLVLVLTAVCYAAVPTRHYKIAAKSSDGNAGMLCVEKGSLELGSRSKEENFLDKDGELDIRDTPDGWFVLGTKVKSSVGGGYLAYDPTGKHNRLVLASKAEDAGTDWIIRKAKPDVKKGRGERGILQAAAGPLKDRFLDVGVMDVTQSDGTIISSRCFVLSKEPGWEVEIVRVIIHL